jgi:Na+/H+ antiporter NhaD/arsenite permease-like protein
MELLSLIALLFVIALSCFTKVNPGLLALGLAWLLGYYGADLGIDQILKGFPIYLLVILVGVTYLFGIAKQNGTLEKLTNALLALTKNDPKLAPLFFFIIAAILSTLGVGNIGAVALLAPLAMTIAWQTGIGAFLMTILLICGANAGTFSPFAFTGIITNGLISKLDLVMNPWTQIYLPNLLAQSILAGLCYLIFYWNFKRNSKPQPIIPLAHTNLSEWSKPQLLTLASIFILIYGTVFLKTDIGFLAIILGCILTLLNVHDGKEAIRQIPWDTILMVCGVNTLISMLELFGGLELLTNMLAVISTPQNATGVIAFTAGILSAFSSSSGVVLPSLIPLVPDLITKMNGGDLTALISSINVGSHLVDVSSLSSLGALCIASALHEDREKLFRYLLAFSLSMAFVGALLCYVIFGLLELTFK